jgi:hypothetical protein
LENNLFDIVLWVCIVLISKYRMKLYYLLV